MTDPPTKAERLAWALLEVNLASYARKLALETSDFFAEREQEAYKKVRAIEAEP